jgi:hypothetical protein
MGAGFCDRSAQATRVRGRVPGWPALTPLRTLLVGGETSAVPAAHPAQPLPVSPATEDSESANEHEESWLVAHDRDVSLAG